MLFLLTALPSSAGYLADNNYLDAVSFLGQRFYLLSQDWSVNLNDYESELNPVLYNNFIDGQVSWNHTTRTLTLKNVEVVRLVEDYVLASYKDAAYIDVSTDITVNIEGDCAIRTAKGYGLRIYGNVTFAGTGTLTIRSTAADLLYEVKNTTITVDGPNIKLLDKAASPMYFDEGHASVLLCGTTGSTLVVKSGSIYFGKASREEGKPVAIRFLDSLRMAEGIGIKIPHGGYHNASTGCLCNLDGSIVQDQEALIGEVKSYGFRFFGMSVTEANYDTFTQRLKNSLKRGTINYDPSANMLTLTDVTLFNNTNEPTIENKSNDGLKIRYAGDCQFTQENTKERVAFRLMENTTFEGATTSAKLTCGEGLGLYVYSGKKLTLRNLNLTTQYLQGGNSESCLNIGDGVRITANGSSNGTVRNLMFQKKVPVKSTQSNPCFVWNRGTSPGVYKNRSTLATGEVFLDNTSSVTKYDIRVGDDLVTSLNRDYIVNEYMNSGYLRWDASNNTMTMNNVDFETNGGVAIEFALEATLNLVGENKILCSGRDDPFAVYSSNTKPLTIKGNTSGASLNVNAYAAEGGSIRVDEKLTIDNATISAPILKATSLDLKNCEVNVTRNMAHVFNAKHTLQTNLNSVVVASSQMAPAYYDSSIQSVVATEGPVRFVRSSDVTTYSGITFCGTEVNSANANCVMNKYVKSGQVEVKKSDNGYYVNLHDVNTANINTSSVFNFQNLSRVDLFVYGTNIFNVGTSSTHFVQGRAGNLFVNGYSNKATLTVNGTGSGNSGAISMDQNSSLYFTKNVAQKFQVTVPRIYGKGSSSRLYVLDPYLTVTGSYEGTVKNINSTLPSETTAELYNTASTPREIREDGIYSGNNICTGEVKFVAKGESYIPVTRITLNKSELAFTKKGETAQLRATCQPYDATNQTVTWESADESVVTVDQGGFVIAKGKGTTSITATCDKLSATCQVTVNIPNPTGITLDRTSYKFESEGVTGIFVNAILTPDNADYDELEWTSSDETIATVRKNSGSQALIRRTDKDGTATITVKTPNGYTATCEITVRLHPTYVEEILFDVPDEVHMKTIGETFTITPTILPANATDKKIRWWSNTEANVRVDSIGQKCIVTAKNYGGSVVFCFAEDGSGVYKSIRVYVDRPPVLATGITIDPWFPETFYNLGAKLQLTATITPANTTNKTVRWESDDETVAVVDEDGLVTIVGWGSCHVTATTTDGSNLTSNICYIDAVDPSTIVVPVPGYALSLDQKEVTIIRGEGTTVGVNFSPGNFNQSANIDVLDDQYDYYNFLQMPGMTEFDQENNRHYIHIWSEPWFEKTGTARLRVYIPDHAIDKEKLAELGYPEDYVPADTLTVHVIDPIIFTAKSVEGIDVTYHVPSLDTDKCEVYCDYEEGRDWDPELLDYACTPAVSVNASGKLTIPSQVTDSSTGKSYWVTSVSRKAFTLCGNLTEIEFSEGIKSIGEKTCDHRMWALEKITLPSSIEELGQQCFAPLFPYEYETGRSGIREVYIKAFTPPTGPLIDPYDETCTEHAPLEDLGVFDMIAEDAVLYVPTGAKENYNHYPWVDGWVVDEDLDEGGFEAEGWFSRIEEMDFFIDEDAIRTVESSKSMVESSWYDLSGRKLDGRPTKPGLYIQGGKKVVIK